MNGIHEVVGSIPSGSTTQAQQKTQQTLGFSFAGEQMPPL
jgi:hypothetical protein